jgi:hypothetical protein
MLGAVKRRASAARQRRGHRALRALPTIPKHRPTPTSPIFTYDRIRRVSRQTNPKQPSIRARARRYRDDRSWRMADGGSRRRAEIADFFGNVAIGRLPPFYTADLMGRLRVGSGHCARRPRTADLPREAVGRIGGRRCRADAVSAWPGTRQPSSRARRYWARLIVISSRAVLAAGLRR